LRYSKIIKAISDYIQYCPASSHRLNSTYTKGSGTYEADFEDIIINWVDALADIKKIKSQTKKLCLFYVSLGYTQYQIAEILQISRSAVYQNIRWLKRFFK